MSGFALRYRARTRLVQAVYQNVLCGVDDVADLESQFVHDNVRFDVAYFCEVLGDLLSKKEVLLARWSPCSTHPVNMVPAVDQAVMYLATYELLFRLDVPNRVVIDQAVELSKFLGSVKSYRFVNATLDCVLSELLKEGIRFPHVKRV